MGSQDYAIKLYGHGSSDSEEFRNDLARVLGMSVEETEELLRGVPVVVKRGMNKRDAEQLHALLRSITAWSILEAPNDVSVAGQIPEKPLYQAIAEDFQEEYLSEGSQGHPWLWFGIMVGLTVFLGLFIVVGLLGFMGSVNRSISPKKPATIETDQSVVSGSDTAESESPDIIRARIQELESSLRSLYERRTEVKESWSLENAVSLERELSNQIRAEYRELRVLKAKLELMESDEQL